MTRVFEQRPITTACLSKSLEYIQIYSDYYTKKYLKDTKTKGSINLHDLFQKTLLSPFKAKSVYNLDKFEGNCCLSK